MSDAPLELQLATAQQELRNVYRERAHLLAFLAAITPASIGETDPDTPGWPVLTLDGGENGQMSWHIAPDDADLFHHVPKGDVPWDGHSTEEKYQRLADMTRFMTELRDAGLFTTTADLLTSLAADEQTKTAPDTGQPEPEPVQEPLTGPQEPAQAAPAPKRRGRPRRTAQAPAQAAGDTTEV